MHDPAPDELPSLLPKVWITDRKLKKENPADKAA